MWGRKYLLNVKSRYSTQCSILHPIISSSHRRVSSQRQATNVKYPKKRALTILNNGGCALQLGYKRARTMTTYDQVRQAHADTFIQLEQIGVCPSCQIRAVSSSCDAFKPEDILACAGDCITQTSGSAPICCICLGVLQPKLALVRKILSALIETGRHEPTSDGYRISLSLPTASFIRESLLEAKLPVSFVLETKDVIRATVAKGLSEHPQWGSIPLSPTGPLNIQVVVAHETAAAEEAAFGKCFPEKPGPELRKEKRKRQMNGPSIKNLLGMLQKGYPKDRVEGDFPPKCPELMCSVDPVRIVRDPLFFTGNYVKLSREMSQTPWVINGVRKGKISVEENLAPVLKELMRAQTAKFHAAGREDVDVRMLGEGRPFVIQLLNCEKSSPNAEELASLQRKLSEGSVIAKNLAFTSDASCMERLKEWEMSKRKKYVCVVWLSKAVTDADLKPLNRTTDLKVLQKTPLRVLHRRSLLDRDKIIHSCSTEILNQHFILLRLCSSAGTYIKEFVHGDRGRTTPNVGSLLGKTRWYVNLPQRVKRTRCT